MANEGMTKLTYSDGYKEGLLQKRVDGELDRQRADFLQKNVWELEAELARVRGLLQRIGKHDSGCEWFYSDRCGCGFLEAMSVIQIPTDLKSVNNRPNACQDCGRDNPVWFADSEVWNSVIPDRVGFLCPICFMARAEAVDFKCTGWKLVPENRGSAETGGEKAAPEYGTAEYFARQTGELLATKPYSDRAFEIALEIRRAGANFPHPSQNQTVSTGVEGAHEGTTADKSELLPTQLPPK